MFLFCSILSLTIESPIIIMYSSLPHLVIFSKHQLLSLIIYSLLQILENYTTFFRYFWSFQWKFAQLFVPRPNVLKNTRPKTDNCFGFFSVAFQNQQTGFFNQMLNGNQKISFVFGLIRNFALTIYRVVSEWLQWCDSLASNPDSKVNTNFAHTALSTKFISATSSLWGLFYKYHVD